MAERRHPPNRLLTWERLQRGWSYEEVADRIRTAMAASGETDTGLCANTVRRWETGERRPDPRYRKHLVVILAKRASELGLLTPDELRLRPDAEVLTEFGRSWQIIRGGTGENELARAEMLCDMLDDWTLPFLTPLLALDPAILGLVSCSERPVSELETYAAICASQRELYWTSPPRPLYQAAYAHTQLGASLLRGATSHMRSALAAHVADSALLTARLAFFDLKQAAVAERCFEFARQATREAGDHARASVVIGHSALVPIFSHQQARARQLLDAARQHTWHGVSPKVRSWLHCVASEAEARAGNGADSRRHIDLALAAFETDIPTPVWMDFYNAPPEFVRRGARVWESQCSSSVRCAPMGAR